MKKLMLMGAFVFSIGAFAQDQTTQVGASSEPYMCFIETVYACDASGTPITDPDAVGYHAVTIWLRDIPNESLAAKKLRIEKAQKAYCDFGLTRHECL